MGVPSVEDITKGFLLLALPKSRFLWAIPLLPPAGSPGFVPERKGLSIKKIGITYP